MKTVKVSMDKWGARSRYKARTMVDIRKSPKTKDGSALIAISTGGMSFALLKYTPSDTISSNIKSYEFKLGTGDTVIGYAGSFTGRIDEAKNKLLDHIFDIIREGATATIQRDSEGFIMLQRLPDYHSRPWNPHLRRRMADGYDPFIADGDDFDDESDDDQMTVYCMNIGKSDDDLNGVVQAISIWGNRVSVNYNHHLYYDYEFRRNSDIGNISNIVKNPGIAQLLTDMEEMGFSDKQSDSFILMLTDYCWPINILPKWDEKRGYYRSSRYDD